MRGKLKVDEYVTHQRGLADINQGFHDMHVCALPIITKSGPVIDFLNRLVNAFAVWWTCRERAELVCQTCIA